jgi:hypothetical protein
LIVDKLLAYFIDAYTKILSVAFSLKEARAK